MRINITLIYKYKVYIMYYYKLYNIKFILQKFKVKQKFILQNFI